jgi:hypothetical protein
MVDETIEPSAQEATSSDVGLLDTATEVETEEGQQPEEISHLEEPKPEKQTRPDWWPENFWKADDDDPFDKESMVKSYNHYKKLVSQAKHKAPEDGNYDTSVFGNTPEDDAMKSHVMNWAGEYGVSQAALDSLVQGVMDMAGEQEETIEVSIAEERKLLGPNADARINGMRKWADGLSQKGILSKEERDEFNIMAGTARGIAILEKIRSFSEPNIPINPTIQGDPISDAELDAMVGDPKYQEDPAYRAKVQKMFEERYN